MPQKHKILITGSSGMLGMDLCQELNEDYEVYGIDIASNRSRAHLSVPYGRSAADADESQRYFDCDITDNKNISGIIAKVKPDIVIHTAAWTDVDGCEVDEKKAYKINSEGAKNVALACKKAGAIPIYISTDFVFDGKKDSPYKEEDRPNPISVYADSKLKGENFIKKILREYFIIRTGWLYGRNGNNFVDTILSKAKKEKVLKVVDDQVGSPTYTKDLAKAIRVLLNKLFTQYSILNTRYGIYHVSNSGRVSWYVYAKMILRLAGSKAKVIPISSLELGRPARRPAMSVLDNSKFIKFTGYRMRNWEDALKEYILNGKL